jgi:hypothetical protein
MLTGRRSRSYVHRFYSLMLPVMYAVSTASLDFEISFDFTLGSIR